MEFLGNDEIEFYAVNVSQKAKKKYLRIKFEVMYTCMQMLITNLQLWNFSLHLCLVLLQVPKCFGLVQIFGARQKIYLQIVAATEKKII